MAVVAAQATAAGWCKAVRESRGRTVRRQVHLHLYRLPNRFEA
jgi:hypothetical protein